MLCATNGTMLYILPPLRTQNPPAPWSSIICSTSSSTNNNNNNNNENNSTENLNSNNNNWRANKPRKIQLRNLQIIHRKRDDSVAHHHDHLDTNRNSKSLSECYFAGKGTALVLPDADATIQLQNQNVEDGTQNGNSLENGLSSSTSLSTFQQTHGSSAIQKHLQSMFYLLRPEETLKMAVKLESVHPGRTRYLVVVSRMGNRGEESCLLGIDCNEETTVGLVLRVLADTKITLDGDGGFSVSVCDSHHIFKPVSVQAMWSALQTLHKVSEKARDSNYFQGGGTHSWVEHYEARVSSDRSCLNEWHAMDCLESRRPPSPDSIRARPTKGDETEKVIRSTLKEIMMSVDLDEVTSKFIRTKLEEELDMNLGQFKSFIDQEMLIILGQMDAPTEIFDHVYLGSEWNASNYEELQRNGVGHILNVTREIDNFFPGTFDYLNVRVYDDDKTDLLKHWDDTFKYITKARNEGSKVLVHCKMGISRSASVVIAYAMKAYNWDFPKALLHVRDKRTCIKPNTNFLTQLETYQGILDAMKNKEKLQRSKSETNLKSPTDNNNRNKNKKSNNNNNKAIKPVESEQINSNHLDDFRSTFSGQDLRQMGERPKSWSPDNLTSREIKEGVKTSPGSISLEDLRQKSSSNESVQETKASLAARHVLMPCDNGESYSVSPNRIVHLPGHDNVVNSSSCVAQKLICDQNLSSSSSLSSSSKEQSSCGSVSEEKTIVIKSETWDPGESSLSVSDNENNLKTNRICDQNKECPSNICSDTTTTTTTPLTVWTSSAVIVTQSAVSANSFNKVPESPPVKNDPFSNQLDHIFECEEKKQQQQQQKKTIIQVDDKLRECPSRQSSWSSYDSAVVLGFNEKNELSRHSSWGSGDTRVLPSRNSSWGSYDTRPRKSVYYVNENGEKILHSNSDLEQSSCGIFPYDKEDIPWHPGTVKRTKQRLESSNHRHLNNDSSVLADSCVSLTKSPSSETLLFNFAEVVADDPLITVNNSAIITEKLNIPPISPQLSSRLSVSAPESCSMELVAKECPSLSRSESNVSSTNNNNDNKVNNSVEASVTLVKRQKSFLENIRRDQAKSRKIEDTLETSQGKVQNLKKEFEAKSGSTGLEQQTIIIQEADKLTNNKKNAGSSLPTSPICIHQSKEQSQKILSEDLNFKTILSVFESKKDDSHHHQVKVRQKVSSTKPSTRNNNARYSCFEVFDKKNSRISSSTIAPFISNLNNKHEKIDGDFKRPPIGPQEKQIGATIIAAAAKKQQQFGKTHPLARINIKSRHNNPVYNTM